MRACVLRLRGDRSRTDKPTRELDHEQVPPQDAENTMSPTICSASRHVIEVAVASPISRTGIANSDPRVAQCIRSSRPDRKGETCQLVVPLGGDNDEAVVYGP